MSKNPICIIMGNDVHAQIHCYDWKKYSSILGLLFHFTDNDGHGSDHVKLNDKMWMHISSSLYHLFEKPNVNELNTLQIGPRTMKGEFIWPIIHKNPIRHGQGRLYLTFYNQITSKSGLFCLPPTVEKVVKDTVNNFNKWSEKCMHTSNYYYKIKIMDTVEHISPGGKNVCKLVYNPNQKEIITPCGQVDSDTILITNWMKPHHLLLSLLHFIGFNMSAERHGMRYNGDFASTCVRIPDEFYQFYQLKSRAVSKILPRELNHIINQYYHTAIITSIEEWKNSIRYHITPDFTEEYVSEFQKLNETKMQKMQDRRCNFKNGTKLYKCLTCLCIICEDCKDDCHYMHRFKLYEFAGHENNSCNCHHQAYYNVHDHRLDTCSIL